MNPVTGKMVEQETGKSTEDSSSRWQRYWKVTEGRPPRPTLLFALDRFAAEGRQGIEVVDLGCGTGRDSLEILRRGHRLLAVDREPEALARLRERVPPELAANLRTAVADLEDWRVPPADLVNASFVLHALSREAFMRLWRNIVAALRPGGRFAGHLLGPKDSWAVNGRSWGLERAELDRLLSGLVVEKLEEEEDDSVTPRGEAKHWHIWHIVARRP